MPQLSHLANHLGKTGKSTANMQMTVTSIMFARYVVREGSGGIAAFTGRANDRASKVTGRRPKDAQATRTIVMASDHVDNAVSPRSMGKTKRVNCR